LNTSIGKCGDTLYIQSEIIFTIIADKLLKSKQYKRQLLIDGTTNEIRKCSRTIAIFARDSQ